MSGLTARAGSRTVVLAAGGTGGHLFPAEALADELRRRGHRAVLMTDARTGGRHGFPSGDAFVLRGAGLAGRAWRQAARSVLELAAGTLQARRHLVQSDASVVVGFGGYPSVAPVAATRLLRRRPAVVLHEQNAVLGGANRQLARFADRIATGMAETRRLPGSVPALHTGTPVRPAVLAAAGVAYAPPDGAGPVRLLVTGGSLGARVFSDAVPAALALLPPALRARLRVVQQCREEDLDRVRAAYAASGIPAALSSFFADLPARMAGAHLVVARAGAGTVAELGVLGRPALLVPLPDAIEGHQALNAAASGAEVLLQSEASNPTRLAAVLGRILADADALTANANRVASHGMADAATRLANLVEAAAQHQGAKA